MDLPTYTSIWRIEKRLYKLYDFRLPMPLPISQMTVFAAIAVPYVVLLTVLGLPFNHTLIWVYILPPGLLTWLATRPVLEGKRLPELIKSQLRYLAEPKVWCRMAASSERDVVLVTGRIWRPARAGRRDRPAVATMSASRRPAATRPGDTRPDRVRTAWSGERQQRVRGRSAQARVHPAEPEVRRGMPRVSWPAAQEEYGAEFAAAMPQVPAPAGVPGAGVPGARVPAARIPAVTAHKLGPLPPRPAWARQAAPAALGDAGPVEAGPVDAGPVEAGPVEAGPVEAGTVVGGPAGAGPVAAELGDSVLDDPDFDDRAPDGTVLDDPVLDDPVLDDPMIAGVGLAEAGLELDDPDVDEPELAEPGPLTDGPDEADRPDQPGEAGVPAPRAPRRPTVTVVGASQQAPMSVERALAGPAARRGDGQPGLVTVVPGGDRPGRPDQLQRDRARAQQPLRWPARVVILGCTVGAGQTVTALLTGEVLASLRTDQVAVLDLNPGVSSLRRRAVHRPALSQAASLSPSRLAVLGPDGLEGGTGEDGEGGYVPRTDPAQDAMAFELAAQDYDIVLADPSTTIVPKLLGLADQLVLVAPASAAAASSITMTVEWLEAHGQSGLVAGSVMVLNGVSRRSLPQVEAAERICAGQCRAIVRVPWDDQLDGQHARRAQPAGKHSASPGQHGTGQHWAGLLSPATIGAYTALAGVLVTALTKREPPEPATHRPPARGQAAR